MKFNKHISTELQEFLEAQYKEYIKKTPMTKKEQRALREWVKDGNSVYENDCGAWYDGGIPMEFLDVFREEEYIRQQTKGMDPEEARRFALSYFGWDDEPSTTDISVVEKISEWLGPAEVGEELPFN